MYKERRKKLDIITNEMLKQDLQSLDCVQAIASEEEEGIVMAHKHGEYLVCFDPLDGSSNIDINSLVGTIFSILPGTNKTVSHNSFLQSGRNQIAAGYMLYGPSTMLVLTTGQGVQLFTLNHNNNTYQLTNSDVKISPDTAEFAINMSNQQFWQTPMQNYINDLVLGHAGPRNQAFNMLDCGDGRDVHRILCRGGIFMYPSDNRNPSKPYKLRLMYEANPLAWLIEQAGGKASTGYEMILDIKPTNIHQRVSVILGSANEVDMCITYHQQ